MAEGRLISPVGGQKICDSLLYINKYTHLAKIHFDYSLLMQCPYQLIHAHLNNFIVL